MFPDSTAGLDGERFFKVANAVKLGAVRVNADEVSCHLHILLRYELEVAMVSGDLQVTDLPRVWNERSRVLLGIDPTSDRDRLLQDSHWAVGMFGYFPSYTIGSLYAARIAEAYQSAHGLTGNLNGGEFQRLLAWLHHHLHQPGYRFSAEDLIRKVIGTGLDASAFFRHVK